MAEFILVKKDPTRIATLAVQSETLCIHAIASAGFYGENPWKYIDHRNRTAVVDMVAAAMHPEDFVRDPRTFQKPLTKNMVMMIVASAPHLYLELPDEYKTDDIRELYTKLVSNDTTQAVWGLGQLPKY